MLLSNSGLYMLLKKVVSKCFRVVGIWLVKPDTWSVKPDTWSVKPDTWSVKPDTWSVKPDTWSVCGRYKTRSTCSPLPKL